MKEYMESYCVWVEKVEVDRDVGSKILVELVF